MEPLEKAVRPNQRSSYCIGDAEESSHVMSKRSTLTYAYEVVLKRLQFDV
jgi:hypothetical protein